MTRKIKANEVEPGMEVQFDLGGWDVRGTVASVGFRRESVWIYTDQSCEMSLDLDDQITVLSEPAPVQPEEPTEFGDKVIVDGKQFLRAPLHSSDPTPWLSHLDGTWIKWSTILAMGPVTVVPDQGWPTQVDASWVPGRVEEWPEDDTALRKYKWRDALGIVWRYGVTGSEHGWSCGSVLAWRNPLDGPWTRVTTNTTHENKEKE